MTSSQLSLHHVGRSFPGRTVLEDVTLSIAPGERVGIIGGNGAGKSTLLRLMAGLDLPGNGTVTVSAQGTGYLPQRPGEAAHFSAHEATPDGVSRRHAEPEDREAGNSAPRTVADALDEALAGVLAANPELLLLDEPTNDLDDSAIGWLEERLAGHRGTVVAVTHDRVFLQRLTDVVLEVESGRVARFGDGYAGYLAGKAAERRRRILDYERWRAELARHEALVERNASRLAAIPQKMEKAAFGHGAFRLRSRGHGAMSRLKTAKGRIERLLADPVPAPAEPLVFRPPLSTAEDDAGAAPSVRIPAGPGLLVSLRGIRVPGEGRPRLELDGLELGPGDRLLLTGPNGAGKSTLLDVLAGELIPEEGTGVVPSAVGYLRQAGAPWPARMPMVAAYARGREGTAAEHVDALLALGLFTLDELRLRVGEMSLCCYRAQFRGHCRVVATQGRRVWLGCCGPHACT
ncbi:ATP-binding cassette domain-containing protein [Zafaria sp. Z1313]|uniref:ATP-binding cassette domain-containing protein n=1 Tax=Zafaria sp. Z1313 TaxID=3423202 RepID=UPI003D303549